MQILFRRVSQNLADRETHCSHHAWIKRGLGSDRGSGPPPPRKNDKNIVFLSKNGPDPLKNHEANKPAFNIGSSLAHQRSAIKMAFHWRANDGLLLAIFGSPHYEKKLSGCAHGVLISRVLQNLADQEIHYSCAACDTIVINGNNATDLAIKKWVWHNTIFQQDTRQMKSIEEERKVKHLIRRSFY